MEVYVSYAWKPEYASSDGKIVDRLKPALEAADIRVRIDVNELTYRHSIRDFMRRIGTAEAVVVVLSEAYFRSPNCLFELGEIFEHGDVHKRVFPLVLKGTRLYDPLAWVEHLRYWEDKKTELETAVRGIELVEADPLFRTLNEYKAFRLTLAKQLDLFANMNTLTQDVHIETNFSALIDSLQAQAPKTPSLPRKPDHQHLRDVAAEIERLLTAQPELQHAFRSQEQIDGHRLNLADPDSNDGRYWRANPELIIENILHPATAAVLGRRTPDNREFQALWSAAKKILGCVCIYAVEDRAIATGAGDAPDAGFEIAVTTKCGIEVVQARRAQASARFKDDRSTDPPGRDAIVSAWQIDDAGWNAVAKVDALLRETWARVMNETLSSSDSLSQDKDRLERLNHTINLRLKNRSEHYYLLIELPSGLIVQPELVVRLKACLPAIGIVFFTPGSSIGPKDLRNENKLIPAIAEFLLIPDRLRENP